MKTILRPDHLAPEFRVGGGCYRALVISTCSSSGCSLRPIRPVPFMRGFPTNRGGNRMLVICGSTCLMDPVEVSPRDLSSS